MSCTENESGPFVVFFLPALVGCLTILLARRWAYSQASNNSTTAYTRRRKIIKDPLIKRPLPPITCKMLPLGAKKVNGMTKKPIPDEELCNGKRGVARVRSSPTASQTSNDPKLVGTPPLPKHIPFPGIPQDSDIVYEIMNFVFMLVTTGLQFLNIYRTVWWLPHSYTNHAMNFHLIDPYIVAFIVTILSRRLLLCLLIQGMYAFLSPKIWIPAVIALRMFTLGILLGAMTWCAYLIALKYPLLKLFYLCYPAVIYFALFGARATPFLELNNTDTPLMHCCTHDPAHIRAEVDILRRDFNMRIKKILFNSVVDAYYSSFIPCCFVQPYIWYSGAMCAQQLCIVWASCALSVCVRLLCAQRLHTLHRAAAHLGNWRTAMRIDSDISVWSGSRLWLSGSRVSWGDALYVSTATGAAEPGNKQHQRFYSVFKNPSKLLCALLCMQISLVLVQVCLLFSSIPWHGYLGVLLIMFMNYYNMFKLSRDYLVSWKVYKAEHLIQDKGNLNT